jgi:MerR family copper efflux transcriptional regulator
MPNLRLIRCALFNGRAGRDLAYSHVGALRGLWHDRARASADVKELALVDVEEINQQNLELQGMRNTLGHLTECCHGDDRPGCPGLKEFAGRV